MTRADIISILTLLVSLSAVGSGAGFAQQINSAFNVTWGGAAVFVLGLVGVVASQALRILSNPSPPAGMVSVVADKATANVGPPPQTEVVPKP